MKLKRIIATLLAATLIVSSLSTSVYADDEITDSVVEAYSEHEEGQETEEAIEVASEEESETEAVSETQNETEVFLDEEPETEVISEVQNETEAVSDTQPETEIEAASEGQSETEGVAEVQNETETVSDAQPETEVVSEAQNETEIVSEVQSELTVTSEEQIDTEEEIKAKGTEKSGAGDNNSGAGDTVKIYNENDVNVSIISSDTSGTDGASKYYKFDFTAKEETNKYSAYVYGNGVSEEFCKKIAAAYFNGIKEDKYNNTVFNYELIDAEKYSIGNGSDYNESLDSELCWAYASANVLQQTGWLKNANAGIFNVDGNASSYFKSEDDISSYFTHCFRNTGGFELNTFNWIFTGLLPDTVGTKFEKDNDDALLAEYYTSGIFEKKYIDTKDDLNTILNSISDGQTASTIGLDYKKNEDGTGGGGHAMTLTGYIRDESGNPIALIVADPDNSVCDKNEPDDKALKSNTYTVYPIQYGTKEGFQGELWYFGPGMTYDAKISDFTTCKDSNNQTKKAEYYIPTSKRAISDIFNNSEMHYFSDNYTLDVLLNMDFLSHYDINCLKYSLLDEKGNVLYDTSISRSKSEWQELLTKGVNTLALYFDEALQTLDDGKYKVHVDVDKNCFLGNYAWFAERYNNNQGYFDRLVDTWVTLLRNPEKPYVPEETKLDNISYPDGPNDESFYGKSGAYQGNNSEMIKSDIAAIVKDLLKAYTSDSSATEKFESLGVDITKADIKNFSIIMSTDIKVEKAGKIKFSINDRQLSPNDVILAYIRLADGSSRYIKARILDDGSVEFDLPENIESITILSL